MNDEIWKEVFVAVVSGLIVSFVTWLLRGTFNLIASHPWVIVVVGVLAGLAMALFRYWQAESTSTSYEDNEEVYSTLWDVPPDDSDCCSEDMPDGEEYGTDSDWSA